MVVRGRETGHPAPVLRLLTCTSLLVAVGTVDCSARHEDDEDGGPPLPTTCPDDMARIPGHDSCVDRYEARIDDEGRAVSAAGQVPTSPVHWVEAERACHTAGKSLCTEEAWLAACTAGGTRAYSYGDEVDPEACNDRNLNEQRAVPTGSLPGCEGGIAGVFDMSGNVCEFVAPCEADTICHCYGGIYTMPAESLDCATRGDTPIDDTVGVLEGSGFRCCLQIQPDDG